MDAQRGGSPIFSANIGAFEAISASGIASLVTAASDLALVLDSQGTVVDVSIGDPDMPRAMFEHWPGSRFKDLVTVETREKVERLLASLHDTQSLKVHVNHPRQGQIDLPILYTVHGLENGFILAIGRDMSPVASANRRLVAAQRSAEVEYTKLREAESRFREFFHLAQEPALFIDEDDRISSANHAASAAYSRLPRLVGRRVVEVARGADRNTLAAELHEVRRTQTPRSVSLGIGRIILAPVRSNPGAIVWRSRDPADRVDEAQDQLVRLIHTMPDGFVTTDKHFSIVAANEAFAVMTEAGSVRNLIGTPLDRWLGRPGVDLSVIRAALNDAGTLRAFATVVKGDMGQLQDVEVSATRIEDTKGEFIGLSIRQAALPDPLLPARSAQQLTELVGRVPIKSIVRETTDRIEQMCIEAALELSGDNRASAAELLGLSRQSLYVKMRRFGIVDADSGTA
ncbi:transcriptional regulator PpsR [Acuticoccus sp. MNP-M23]|uniref:transcriptional regulator PpsR n=1 Tax=Acuticoccus sp. MNP-M23 TaxID=3072793 RepID=UPI00281580D5|nr:transcriptional regulator PpsR [Acuticoccus sp. MNP-M23]WMS42697.1 transcriptional regulator PpsR [Acuticoccus sp. MNP-M23]